MTHTKNKRGAYFFFLALLVIELTFFSSTTVNSRPVLSSEELQEKVGYNDYTVDALSYLKSIDNSFFRVSKYYDSGPAIHASLNDGMAQGYRGLTSYDSFNQGYYVKFMTALGVMNMSDEINFPRWAFGLEARPFLQILLSAKYALSKMSYADIFMNGGRLINSFGDVAVYQNEFFLPFGFTYQGYLSFDDFNKMSASQRDVALLQTCVINEKDGRAFEGLRLFEINDVKNSTAPAEVRAYVENLGSEALLIDQQSQNHIHGTITLQKRKILFLSIPYDRGWMVRVDGEKIKPYIVNVGFMGFPLGQGKHTVELCYRSPLLVEGAVISLIGIFAYLMFVLRGMIKSCGLGFKKE